MGPGLSPQEASLPLPCPHRPPAGQPAGAPTLANSQKLSTGSNRRLHADDPEHRSDPRGPIYMQVIFKNTAPLRDQRLADSADRGLTPSYTRVLLGRAGLVPPPPTVFTGRLSRHQVKRAARDTESLRF